MKKNKKGFTLIELLAVIAILAILVVIAVPAVLDLFKSSRKSAFITQAQTLLKATEQQIITDSLSNTTPKTIYTNIDSVLGESGSVATCSSCANLDLNGGTAVQYYFKTRDTEVVCMVVYNDLFAIKLTTLPKVSDITDTKLETDSSSYKSLDKTGFNNLCSGS